MSKLAGTGRTGCAGFDEELVAVIPEVTKKAKGRIVMGPVVGLCATWFIRTTRIVVRENHSEKGKGDEEGLHEGYLCQSSFEGQTGGNPGGSRAETLTWNDRSEGHSEEGIDCI